MPGWLWLWPNITYKLLTMTGEEEWLGPGPGGGRLWWLTGTAGGRSTSSFVICHFSTLYLEIIHSVRNYILRVQLHTVCVGLPTIFKAVPSTYPADNSTPARIVSPNHRLRQILGCMHTGAGHPIHPQVDDLRQSQSESSLFLSYMAHYSINYLCVCKHKLWLNSQQNSLTINLIFLKAWPWG